MKLKLGFILISVALLAGTSIAQTTKARKTVWNGVYTPDQAARGKFEYEANCANCHRTYNDTVNPESKLAGDGFMERWREDNLEGFFDLVKATMPRREPGSLEDRIYVDIIAHILQKNNFPSGKEELKLEGLKDIQVEGQFGPQPLPGGALVQLVGCLIQDGSNWSLTKATEPARTRRSMGSTATELETATMKPLGNQTFRLQNVDYLAATLGPDFNMEVFKGQKMQAKGFLVRQPNRPRVDLTSMERISTESCAQ